MNDLVSKVLFAGRYRLRKRLGKGSLWEVWLADNEMAGYQQVVKVFAPIDEPGSRVFRREFAKSYHLMHPRLLRATYFDIHDHRPYLVMPYCRSGSAIKLVGKLNEGEIARLMKDVCSALAYIHQPAYRIAHQDIQPDNILLGDKGEYLLSDSSISAELREAFHRYAAEKDMALSSDAGMLPSAYHAPEYFIDDDEKSKALMASDIWALGATLYELAAGHPPFGQRGGEEQHSDKALPDLPPPSSWQLSNIIQHCMSKDPSARPSAENLAQMAEGYLSNGQWPVRYFNNSKRSWSAKHWARRQKPFFKRAVLGVAFLTVVLVIATLLNWPGINKERTLTENESVVPDMNLISADPLPTSSAEKEALNSLLEVKETTPSIEEITSENTPLEEPSESSLTDASADLVQTATPPSAPLPTKEPTTAPQSAASSGTPVPEHTIGTDSPKHTKGETSSKAQAKAQSLELKFNGLTDKWGYINKKGTWIIWPQFEKAAPFENGKAKVAKKANDGSLRFYHLDEGGGLILISQKDTIADSKN